MVDKNRVMFFFTKKLREFKEKLRKRKKHDSGQNVLRIDFERFHTGFSSRDN